MWHDHFIYPVYTGVEKFRDEFAIARSTLGTTSGPLPIGAGFLGWKLEEPGSPHVQLLEVALENGVRAIWLSFGEDLGRWIEFVRNHDQQTGKSPKTLVFLQVNSVDEALVAAQSWKVDVLVAQGKNRLATTTLPLGPAFITHHMLLFFHPFSPRFRNRIGRTWLSFRSTRPQSRFRDTVRTSPLRSPTRTRGGRTVQRWTPRCVPNSRGVWCRGGHAFPRGRREPVLGGAKASHYRCQVLRAILRVRRTSRYNRVAGRGRWPWALHPRFGGS